MSWSTERSRRLLLASIAIYVAHAFVHREALFVDAAIPAAMADNLASGLGFAAYPGAAWVEGFTSPLWVLLLTPAALLGLPTTVAAQLLGVALGAGGLALSWQLARRMVPDPRAALAAPLFLACSTTWVTWSVSGMEYVPFGTLLLAAITRLIVERDEPTRKPLSALLLGLLVLARPEGLVFALALGASWVFTVRGRGRLIRLVLLSAPLLIWQAVRVAGFGEGAGVAVHLSLERLQLSGSAGWRYLAEFSDEGRLLLLAAVIAGAFLGRGQGLLRRLLITGVLVGAAWAWLVQGDWAQGHRLLVPVVAVAAPLLAAGLSGALRLRRGGRVAFALLLLGVLGVELADSDHHRYATSVAEVRLRIAHIQAHADSIGLEDIAVADVDVGPFYLDTDWPVVDCSGRFDVALAQEYTEAAVARRVLEEARPTYVHVHGGWASKSGLLKHPDWDATYVEIPGYEMANGHTHVGTYVRRELLPDGGR